MNNLCEKVHESLTSDSGSLSNELRNHCQNCPECSQLLVAFHELQHSRKSVTAKEASSITAINAAVKKAVNHSTNHSIKTALIAFTLVSSLAIGGLVFYRQQYQQTRPEKLSITSVETTKAVTTTQTNEDSAPLIIQIASGCEAIITKSSAYEVNKNQLNLLNGSATINAKKTPVKVRTSQAIIEMANAQCSVSTEADKIEIKVISGKISVTASEKGEKIILSQGQNWTPEQDAIDKVGTLLISPDSEDITVE
jgi:hypothetical protein